MFFLLDPEKIHQKLLNTTVSVNRWTRVERLLVVFVYIFNRVNARIWQTVVFRGQSRVSGRPHWRKHILAVFCNVLLKA